MKLIKDLSKRFLTGVTIANCGYDGNMESNEVASNNTTGTSFVLAPIVTAINAMLDKKVSALLVDSYENPKYYIEINVNNKNCAILFNPANNTYVFDWDSNKVDIIGNETLEIPISFVPYVPRLLDMLYFKDSEFFEYYSAIKEHYSKHKNLTIPETIKLCDLVYNQALTTAFFDGTETLYDFDIENIKWETISNINILENISPIMGHSGDFVKMSFGNNNVQGNIKGANDLTQFSFGLKVKKEFKNEAFFPKMPKDVVIRPEMLDIARYAYMTKDDEQPLNNFSLFGPTGSGKSFICKYLASERCFGIPYITVACSGNKDESMFTGMYQNGDEGKTIFVNSKFAEYIQMPCVIELVEANSLDEDVAIALNTFMDRDYGYLITDNLKPIKRHPNCIVVSTFNPGYAGTKSPNRSVIRRYGWCAKVDKISEDEIKHMLIATSKVEDEEIINFVYKIFEIVEDFILEQEIDGEVSMDEYAMCAKFLALDKKMGIHNPMNVIQNTIINKLISTIDFDNDTSQELSSLLMRKVGAYC